VCLNARSRRDAVAAQVVAGDVTDLVDALVAAGLAVLAVR
jgi:hypothetical protein